MVFSTTEISSSLGGRVAEGVAVGSAEALGSAEGSVLGATVGSAEGSVLGATEGSTEGSAEGSTEGSTEGSAEAVGLAEGVPGVVGVSVGEQAASIEKEAAATKPLERIRVRFINDLSLQN